MELNVDQQAAVNNLYVAHRNAGDDDINARARVQDYILDELKLTADLSALNKILDVTENQYEELEEIEDANQ